MQLPPCQEDLFSLLQFCQPSQPKCHPSSGTEPGQSTWSYWAPVPLLWLPLSVLSLMSETKPYYLSRGWYVFVNDWFLLKLLDNQTLYIQTLSCRRRPLGAHVYCHCCVFGGTLMRGYSRQDHLGADGYCKIQDMSGYKQECCPRWGWRHSNTGESHDHGACGLSQSMCETNALSMVPGKPESCGRHKLLGW